MEENKNIENQVPEPEEVVSAEEVSAAEEEGFAVKDVEVRKLSDKYAKLMGENGKTKTKLTGLFRDWFLDYASYVILERAVPYIDDGLKPVQRRILHSMRRMYDGSRIKVANIVGHTMQFHPHGDASIGDALVQLGQKNLLIDTQGNWGNILTGDGAAAPRYIEARLSKFALEVVFSPKITEWMLSYDGRNKEPVSLPVKFPLLLAQGVEGIAVGLSSKILPHNFNELLDGCVAHLKGEDFELYPDFPTGGLMDVSRYNDGLRGGAVKVRARINKVDPRTIAITEIPFTTTSESVKESIVKASEAGRIKIKSVDDNTASTVELLVHVAAGESIDKTIDALYTFTDCEISISPNSCVIRDERPCFLGVKDILRHNAEHTRKLLGMEQQVRLDELNEEWHMASLERIFIQNKIYQVLEKCKSPEEAYEAVDNALEPFKKLLRREVTREDVVKLTELKFIRITRYDLDKADNHIKAIEKETKQVKHNLAHLTEFAIDYFEGIKERYGKGRERKTEIRAFDSIAQAKVAVVNSKLYVDREGGFFGIGTQMRQAEYVCDCSDLDDIIVFLEDGRYVIRKVLDKDFFAPGIIYVGVFRRGDERTIYNVLYRDGDKGANMMKRCAISAITRDKEYNITKGTPKSRVLYMSVNPNGEAETLKIIFRQRAKLKKAIVDLDFSTLAIKGRASQGNIFSRNPIHKILLKSKGASTLSGQQIWYDEDIKRLNDSGHGRLLGEFKGSDKIIVFTAKDQFYTTGYDVGHHFPEDTVRVEKYDSAKIYSVAYWDEGAGYYYIKRFQAEDTDRMLAFVDEENPKSRSVAISDEMQPALEVIYGGAHITKPADIIDVQEFIGVKGYKAKGKRVSTYIIDKLRFIPKHFAPDAELEEPEEGEVEAQEAPEQQLPAAVESIALERKAEEPTEEHTEEVVEESVAEEEEPQVEEPAFAPKAEESKEEPASVPAPASAPAPAPKVEAVQKEEPVGEIEFMEMDAPMPQAKPRRRAPKVAAPEPVITTTGDDVELEIIIPKDEDDVAPHIDSQQLNLF
ncbi:MAG: DNA gyrase/topoisomerase IV subunit A [Tidjanibacter sp.]|nr:DNA gyrase/topoisomerase IV subunit A [Tidjanibacter sp.]